MMIYRLAQPSDAEAIAANNLSLAKELENLHLSKEEAEKGSKAVLMDKQKGFYLVAEQDNNIIGQLFITTEWSDWRNKAIWWIHRVFIKKPWRKKGIFTHLFNTAKQIAEKQQVYAIRLYLWKTNKTALTIYHHLGFKETDFLILQKKEN